MNAAYTFGLADALFTWILARSALSINTGSITIKRILELITWDAGILAAGIAAVDSIVVFALQTAIGQSLVGIHI